MGTLIEENEKNTFESGKTSDSRTSIRKYVDAVLFYQQELRRSVV